uniref:Uncharacterized protein n=1 Tax=mine drainage metagenome TaxID=410659 RepID=E6PN10_9ZZZZ
MHCESHPIPYDGLAQNAGDALTALGCKIGPTNEDFAAFEQDRDKAPAKPVRFE